MKKPLVSVVIPVYNVEQYLNRCVESVINQTYTNLEIILVDDGSSDKCPSICDWWAEKDTRITVVHKKNAGLGMARNTGIENASGKYVFFFDSDDYVAKTTVEQCVCNAEKYNSDVVIFGNNDVYEDGRIVAMDIVVNKEVFVGTSIVNELLPSIFTYDYGFGCSSCMKMYNLDVIKKLKKRFVSEKEIISEDAYFVCDLLSDVSVVTVLRENFYYYYKRSGSLSRTCQVDRQEKNNIFYNKMCELLNRKNLSDKVLCHVTARYQMYSISTMKQIIASDLTKKQKNAQLRKVLLCDTLRESLRDDVIRLHNRSLRLFFKLLRNKCYCICIVLLRIRMWNDR